MVGRTVRYTYFDEIETKKYFSFFLYQNILNNFYNNFTFNLVTPLRDPVVTSQYDIFANKVADEEEGKEKGKSTETTEDGDPKEQED